MKKILFAFFILLGNLFICHSANAQIQFVNAADSVEWTYGSDNNYGQAFFNNDTFVINTSHWDENNYMYGNMPMTLNGAASVFTASFDFRMDSSNNCSDGLVFWFFTSPLSGLGNPADEGYDLGFPSTTVGFALAMQTSWCMDNIFLKKINSNNYSFCGSCGIDTDICSSLDSQAFLTDGNWHHCVVDYNHGNITVSYDNGAVVMSGYKEIYGTGHFGFMATNGAGYTRKSLKNIQINNVSTPTDSTNDFGVYVNQLCNGPQFSVQANTYSPNYSLITQYGDGTADTSSFTADQTGGYAILNHTYSSAGSYSVKQVLYNSAMPIDSLLFDYENIFCATLPIKFYYDNNNNCVQDGSEPFLSQPVSVEVDSNNVVIDTISATSGLYYYTHGNAGDIYTFKVISAPTGMYVSCPSTGQVEDTLVGGTYISPVKYAGLTCTNNDSFDLQINPVIPVTGINDEWGDIYVQNAACLPENATVTLQFSPKYAGTPNQIYSNATSVSGNTIIWNLNALSNTMPAPYMLHYSIWAGSTQLTIGDTVMSHFSVTPMIGDIDTTNNVAVIIDTIRGGCDPNEMSVNPANCIPSAATQLQYTINFTNTGNDTAFNIYVMDTLPANVNVKSLKIVSASATMNTSIISGGSHNIARFDFPHINLLDSMQYPEFCSGDVIFTINTMAGLADNATVKNHAGVFFDDNPVVLTDTVTNTVGCSPTSVAQVKGGRMGIYPNPATSELTITNTENIRQISITNVMGQECYTNDYNAQQVTVNIANLPAGIYFVKVNGDVVRKFVKE